MRVGLFSDLHLHNFKPFSQPVQGGINTRAEHTLGILIQVAEIADREDLDLVCFCGDFWHARGYLSVPLFNEAHRLLQEIPCDVAMIRGQHDLATREFGAPSGIDIFGEIDGVHILDGSHAYKRGDMIVYGCNSDETLDDIEIDDGVYYKERPKILLMHTIIKGCQINQTFKAEEGMSLKKLHKFMDAHDISRCFLGDIHLKQAMSKRVHYIGCAIQQSFGEEDYETDMTIWTPEKNRDPLISLGGPRFVTVPKSFVDNRWYDGNNYFRVQVGNAAKFKKLSRDPKWNVKLIPPVKKTSKSRSSIKLDTDKGDAIRSYVKNNATGKKKKDRLMNLGLEIMGVVR